MDTQVSRRYFLKVSGLAGAGMLVSFSLFNNNSEEQIQEEEIFSPNAYIKIGSDNTITLMAPNPEIGQGIKTSLPLIIAEELGVDWKKIHIELAPLGNDFGRQMTGGSNGVRARFEPLRVVGATARVMLIAAAAQKWGVSEAECMADDGMVIHTSSGKKVTYGALAATAATLEVPENPTLKDPKDFKYIGSRVMDVDAPKIVMGKPLFGIDTRKEGMLFAVVARPPAYGKSLGTYDDTEARKVNGVKDVVAIKDKIAVLATSTWAAKKGRDALKITWETTGRLENSADHYQDFEEILKKENTNYSRNDGDVESVMSQATDFLGFTYFVQTLSHGQMEPLNFYADVQEGKAELYGPTQVPERVRDEVAEQLGISKDKISLGVPRQGGGFGRKLMNDNGVEAALISAAAKVPVQVQWMREDDMQHDFYRPSSMFRYRAALAKNKLLAWHQSVVGIGGMRGDSYVAGALDNYRSDVQGYESNTPTGWWRAPGANALAFPAESFMDEVCIALKKDPVAFRLELFERAKTLPVGTLTYDPEKYMSVVKLVAEMAGWGKTTKGTYRGFATWYSFGSYAAQVVDIILVDGKPRITKVFCAVNCGTVVNRSGAENQVQGAIVDGICHAMFPKITFKEGAVQETNFNRYKFLHMKDAPLAIEVKFVESTDAPTGLGEPALPPVAAAVANAIYLATGKRIRSLPLVDGLD